MATVVQKYGGSSVADLARIRAVAKRVLETHAAGNNLVVVVSAMGDTTDHLLKMAREISRNPDRRELDMLLTVGERISMTLLCMAIRELGGDAISFTGSQCGIITDGCHFNAKIKEVRPTRVLKELERGRIVVVAGYQGVSELKEITTLGRGGSDTTAVALAAALGAHCEIYSDVDGVYSADPRIISSAQRLVRISYEQMQELSLAGARVLNADAVEFAKKEGITIRALGLDGNSGTFIDAQPQEQTPVLAVAGESELLIVRARVEPSELLQCLEEAGVCGRQFDGFCFPEPQFSVLVAREQLPQEELLASALRNCFGEQAQLVDGFGAVSAIGHGLNSNYKILLKGTKALPEKARAINANCTRVTWVVPRWSVAACMQALHATLVCDGMRLGNSASA